MRAHLVRQQEDAHRICSNGGARMSSGFDAGLDSRLELLRGTGGTGGISLSAGIGRFREASDPTLLGSSNRPSRSRPAKNFFRPYSCPQALIHLQRTSSAITGLSSHAHLQVFVSSSWLTLLGSASVLHAPSTHSRCQWRL